MLSGSRMLRGMSFATDTAANLISTGVLAASGLALHFIIAAQYGADGLGLFNQVYALYVVLSQVAALGIQMSVLRHVPEFGDDRNELAAIVLAALIVVVLSGTFWAGALLVARGALASAYGSPQMSQAIVWAVPGLFLFTVNKVLLGTVNGMSRMKVYALLSAVRGLGMLAALAWAVKSGAEHVVLPVVLTAGESACFVLSAAYVACSVRPWPSPATLAAWALRHVQFGVKGLAGGMLAELHTRVDVLMLGLFVSDATVGVYAFAAMLAEGASQIPYVLRRVFDPVFTRLWAQERLAELAALSRMLVRRTLAVMAALGAVAFALYPLVVDQVVGNAAFTVGWVPFGLLMAGVVASGAYGPLSGALIQSGRPGAQTMYILLTCLTNVVLNALLIPLWGIHGAAAATALAMASSVVYLRRMVRLRLGLAI